MADKREAVIKLTDEQRAQIKTATGQELPELMVGRIEHGATMSANYSDDRSLLGAVLDDRYSPPNW